MKRTLIVLTCSALVCAFLLAGGRPVAVVTAHIYPADGATWSEEEAKYTYTITYLVDDNTRDSVSLPQAALPGGIPATIAITHYDGTTTVTMKEVERSAQSYKTEGARQSKVTVTYEGRVSTTFNAELDVGTTSEKIIIDRDPSSQKSIGPDGEGTTRLVPETQMTITQVMASDDDALGDRIYVVIPALISMVNEDVWAPSATEIGSVGVAFSEGEWLFVGADTTHNRDDSFTIVYSFVARLPFPTTNEDEGMGFFRWFYTRDIKETTDDGTERSRKEVLMPEQQSQIYLLAGADSVFSFSDLDL